MKRFFLFLTCLIAVEVASAQKSLLSLDEHNKYIYYQVVDRPGISADSLQKSVAYFVKDIYPKNKSAQMTQNGAGIKDKFLTYTSLVKHENGEMAYNLTIECKEGKYRYWLTDFLFTPYEKNRYGVFVPVNGVEIPLENASSKLTQKDVDGYFDQTGAFCKQLGEKLKKYMTENHSVKNPDQQPVKKIVTDKW
ncbi:DUF4468 domain-containing protein [Mucilaginibacter sp. McL0603]|uniref:DUF4468 domain-containing protein n=1 Tax=Mucilaginibacter sp. McL0603 TaxID=3415670 RepID=UPI003CF1751D